MRNAMFPRCYGICLSHDDPARYIYLNMKYDIPIAVHSPIGNGEKNWIDPECYESGNVANSKYNNLPSKESRLMVLSEMNLSDGK